MNKPILISASRKSKRMTLTPLIDVVFILLLFFMLTSSFQRWSSFDIPHAASSSQAISASEVEPIYLLLYSSGKIVLWPEGTSWNSFGQIKPTDLLVTNVKNQRKDFLLIPEYSTSLQTMITTAEYLKKTGLSVNLSEPVAMHDE
ncbi:ExbD/TolR family protein [Aliikangiella maris]|uniref:Biopolymer transporter ExbD n=2 Tax=Aliikangiella maris TaxID=3162458 RepID=A0ABV2BUB6_9GAMM